jgi:hypothetical protein
MSFYFYLDFTPEDRIKFEPKINNGEFRGLRIKYQSAKKLDKVNYSTVGFDPFFEWDWLTIVKYENMKGEAIKDLMRPSLVSYSPHGLHVKENWGKLDNLQFIAKVIDDLKNFVDHRIKYDETLSVVDADRKTIADRNLVRVGKLANFIFDLSKPESVEAFNNIYEGQTLVSVPEPEEDDWILEENSIGANRVEKRAHRGPPDFLYYGPFRVLTYERSGEDQE